MPINGIARIARTHGSDGLWIGGNSLRSIGFSDHAGKLDTDELDVCSE